MTKPVFNTAPAVLALASIFLTDGAHGQKKNEPPANGDSFFSSDTRLVVIDSIVTDKKGAPVGDLTQREFRIREDGKEQSITSFSYLGDEGQGGQKQHRVLFFDNSTVPQIDQRYARDAATKFIGSNAGPDRLTAVVEFGQTLRVTQNLTDDIDKLKQAVNGAKLSVALTGTMGGVGMGINRSGTGSSRALPEALRNLARGLARVAGRKTVILLSEGTTATSDQMKGAIDECNRANVAIYPVDVRALITSGTAVTTSGEASVGRISMTLPNMVQPPNTRSASAELSEPQSASDALYGLARGTGGFVLSSPAKLVDDLNRVGKEESQYYALGYLPVKESKPGACHAIKVDVSRGGANVRARTGYCDEITPEVQTGTPTERDLEARLNASEKPTVQATMQAPFFYVAPNTVRVDLTLDIPGAGVKFARDKGKFSGTLNVIGIAYLPDGGVAARFNDTAKVMLDDQQQVDDFASRPFHFEKQFEMASGAFDLKVAFSSGAATFGTLETKLTIDPWDPSKFLLSGLALSQTTRPASAAGLGAVDLFGDRVPLNANGVQFIPAGTNRLLKSQKAFVYGEIYEPALSGPDRKGDPGVGAQLTVLNAKTGEIVKQLGFPGLKPETVPAGTSAIPFGMILPVDELAPGSYSAQITAQDAAGNRFVRRIAFELEP